jgi:uncharacterized membrane protein YgaE (UPF0421/DUF939 family)
VTPSRLGLAAKTAIAAALAWVMVQPLGGVADDYPYFAPLGAVVSVWPTVASSLRATASALLAIALGAGLALTVMVLPTPEIVAVALVVAVGTCLAGWQRVRAMATWVPISGLFVLILGHTDPVGYVAAYLGLTGLGACLGIAVNLAFPSLPLLATRRALGDLRDDLALQLDELAQGLVSTPPPSAGEWRDRRLAIDPQIEEMQRMVAETHQAQHANWRARRWRELARRQYREARALEQLTFLVEEIIDLLATGQDATRDEVALGPHLRPGAAAALRATGSAMASVDADEDDHSAWVEARRRNDELAGDIRRVRAASKGELFVAGSLVTTIRRALNVMAEREPAMTGRRVRPHE